MPEIAIVGRSNVGKSSLINHLLRNKKLAKTSSTPGKTQSLNFFTVDEKLVLVDLPGYGFAKVSSEMKEQWSQSIEAYLDRRKNLKVILFLIDSRRTPSPDDCIFIKWAATSRTPFLIIFTKADKLSENQKRMNALTSLEVLNKFLPKANIRFLYYSIKDQKARMELIENINVLITE